MLQVRHHAVVSSGRMGRRHSILIVADQEVDCDDLINVLTEDVRFKVGIATLIRATAENRDQLVDRYRGRHLDAHFDRVKVVVDDRLVNLTRRELGLLRFLVTHPNHILSRADILAHVWRNENDGRSRTVDVHIRRLRIKLASAGRQIQTVTGVGYRFNE